MEFDINVYPEDEEEVPFVEQLAAIREYGIQELDLDRYEVAMLMIQTGSAILDPNMEPPMETDVTGCPKCGSPLRDVSAGELGGSPQAEPCGCELTWAEVPEKFTPS